MKTLMAGEIRFLVKKIDKLFRVYDRARGSYPYQTPELGKVVQDVPEAEAQAEADRLNEQFVGKVAEFKKQKAAAKGGADRAVKGAKQPETVQAAEEIEPLEDAADLPEYEMSDEQKAAYTEGLFEKTVY